MKIEPITMDVRVKSWKGFEKDLIPSR